MILVEIATRKNVAFCARAAAAPQEIASNIFRTRLESRAAGVRPPLFAPHDFCWRLRDDSPIAEWRDL